MEPEEELADMGFEGFKDKLIYDFSLRTGGVSTGCYSSLNLSATMGDDDANVLANTRIWLNGLGIDTADMVMVNQTHTTNILRVDESYAGECIRADLSRTKDIDGIVTNVKGLALTSSHADCVPLYFYDPLNEAIGIAHSGWRGTVGELARKMVERMSQEFGSDPPEIHTRIGPCISQKYFACDRDVIDEIDAMSIDCGAEYYFDEDEGKYHASLAGINRRVMLAAGVRPEHIDMADECTYSNPEKYYSHRRDGRLRGGHKAILAMKRD